MELYKFSWFVDLTADRVAPGRSTHPFSCMSPVAPPPPLHVNRYAFNRMWRPLLRTHAPALCRPLTYGPGALLLVLMVVAGEARIEN
jgi:hypothetical protein